MNKMSCKVSYKASHNVTNDGIVGDNVTGDSIGEVSDHELLETVRRTEIAVSEGTAELQYYEAFVLCKKELARRAYAASNAEGFRS